MNWFDILKFDFAFDPQDSLGFYDEVEGKVNLSRYGKDIQESGRKFKPNSDFEQEIIERIIGTGVHEDVHAAIYGGKPPAVVFREMFAPSLEAAIENVFRRELSGKPNWVSIIRSPDLAKKVDLQMQQPMQSLAYFIMIDEIFATEAGYAYRMPQSKKYITRISDRDLYEYGEAEGGSKKELANLKLDMLEGMLRNTIKVMKQYISDYINVFKKLCQEIALPTTKQKIGELLRQNTLPLGKDNEYSNTPKEAVSEDISITFYNSLLPLMIDSFSDMVNKNMKVFEENAISIITDADVDLMGDIV
jgi:hypothetical protein|tara:strand:- start:2404 stop:3315 length:912 start_codon:yes stop_codon:yes gene_type:complete